MLTSLVLQVRVDQAARLPAGLGRASQALLLRLIQVQDPTLSVWLHEEEGLRPYTAPNLVLGRHTSGSLIARSDEDGWLRFTGLTEEVSTCLARLAENPPEVVDMDGCSLRVIGATIDATLHPWAAQSDYQTLATRHLLAGEHLPAARITLEFTSLTTFRSSGRYCTPAAARAGLRQPVRALAGVCARGAQPRGASLCCRDGRRQPLHVAHPLAAG